MTKEIDAAAEAMKEQISKMMKNFKLPDVDMTVLVEGQRTTSATKSAQNGHAKTA